MESVFGSMVKVLGATNPLSDSTLATRLYPSPSPGLPSLGNFCRLHQAKLERLTLLSLSL